MPNEPRVIVYPDRPTLAQDSAERFLHRVVQVIGDFDEANVVLTGGTMGIAVLEAIAASPRRDEVDWRRVNVWWGDERWLPKGHPERNDQQAQDALLRHVDVDPARVHPFAAADEGLTLDEAADAYAVELAVAAPPNLPLPAFDITYLGVGPDGHVASLFPNTSALRERTRTVVAVRQAPKPPAERLSLTLPVINSSARIVLVLAGADKASVLGLALAGASSDEVPVAGVLARRRTVFRVDAEAAAQVPQNLLHREEYWTAADG